MKKIKITGFVLCIALSLSNYVLAQSPNGSGGSEVICINKDYEFEIEDKYHPDKSTARVCPKNTPFEVTAVDATDPLKPPVSGTFEWKKNAVIQTGVTSNTIIVTSTDFINNKVELECEFTDVDGNQIYLELDIKNNIELEFDESAKLYSFDDNEKQKYIDSYNGAEKKGTPWNFIEIGAADNLMAEVSRTRGFNVVKRIESNSPNISISPSKMINANEVIAFNHNGGMHEIIEVRGCQNTDPELLLYTESAKMFEMELYRICESDDDDQILPVGTMVTSSDAVCIDGGDDGSIDLMLKPGFIPIDPVTKKPLDDLEYNSTLNKFQILAGTNLRCDTEANQKSPPECPGSFNEMDFVNGVNDIFGNVAISWSSISIQTINVNYDVVKDDGILDNEEEQNHLATKRRIIDKSTADGRLEVYFVEDLGLSGPNNLQGKAIGGQQGNMVAIDREDGNGGTLAHEIGHAKWGLEHPGNPPDNQGKKGQFGIDDTKNFMHGLSNGRINNIRRYQFHLLH